ncbi:MAG: AraC family transcriptional regulator [Tannerellaceae bacterium]|nr:AraC family transcriptional regulator [Tannerellaceae bacterium]
MEVLREITPLSPDDCFMVMQRTRYGFAYPLHIHPEFELNFLENALGAIRMVEDSIEEMGDLDLVLVAGGTKHAYSNHKCAFVNVHEITIQFNASMLDSLIDKRPFKKIRHLFENARRGIVFSLPVVRTVEPLLKTLSNESPDSFRNLMRFLEILKELSMDEHARPLNAANNTTTFSGRDCDRLDMIMRYLNQNYQRSVSLAEVASLVSMSEASLNRFLKKWTGKTFVDNLNIIRMNEATSRLLDTSDTIAEICYKSGFNNLSHFNRVFKKLKGATPTRYREEHIQTRFRI